jgi:hypothetical protein
MATSNDWPKTKSISSILVGMAFAQGLIDH